MSNGSPSESRRIAILGAGNIGNALIAGLLRAGVAPPERLIATARTPERARQVAGRHGIRVLSGGNLEATESSSVIIAAVRPASLARLLEEIRWGLREDRLLVSLAAGVPIAVIERQLGRRIPVFRATPNLAVGVAEGATGLAWNAAASPAHCQEVESIFAALGVVCRVEEDLLHAVAALSGGGPAYICMVIEALTAGGLKMGLPQEAASLLASQTVLGAARLARESSLHPAILKDQVMTPGGAAIAAVHELERHGLRSMLISAVECAANQSRLLASEYVSKTQPGQS